MRGCFLILLVIVNFVGQTLYAADSPAVQPVRPVAVTPACASLLPDTAFVSLSPQAEVAPVLSKEKAPAAPRKVVKVEKKRSSIKMLFSKPALEDGTAAIIMFSIALLFAALAVFYILGAMGSFVPALFYYIGAAFFSVFSLGVTILLREHYYAWGWLWVITAGLWLIPGGAVVDLWIFIIAAIVFGLAAIGLLIGGIIKASE